MFQYLVQEEVQCFAVCFLWYRFTKWSHLDLFIAEYLYMPLTKRCYLSVFIAWGEAFLLHVLMEHVLCNSVFLINIKKLKILSIFRTVTSLLNLERGQIKNFISGCSKSLD